MAPCLEEMPYEVMEMIAVLLDLRDLCNIRLASRSMEVKATQDHFKSQLRTKRVYLTEAALGTFVQMTNRGGLGCLIQNLTLVSIAKRSEKDARSADDKIQQDDHVNLLIRAFEYLAAESKSGMLDSLCLEVAVLPADGLAYIQPDVAEARDRKPIWLCTAHTFSTTIRSLGASKLRLKKLNVFNSPHMQGCSLPCNELAIIDSCTNDIAPSLAQLETLSIGLSNAVTDGWRDQDCCSYESLPAAECADAEAKIMDSAGYNGFAQLLSLSDQIAELELHYFQIDFNFRLVSLDECHHALLFQHLAQQERLPRLERLLLRGLFVRQEDLVLVRKRMDPLDLHLEAIWMHSSTTFVPVFAYCISSGPRLERLCFHDLNDHDPNGNPHIVYFDGPGSIGKPSSPVSHPAARGRDHSDIHNTLVRTGHDIRQSVQFWFAYGRTCSTQWTYQRQREQRAEYGHH